MVVYAINFMLILVWEILFLRMNPNDRKKRIFCGIVALQWILISGLRNVSISADVAINYVKMFEDTKGYSWEYIFSMIREYLFNGLQVKDPGYTLLMKIFQIFSDDFQMWLVFIAAVFTIAMAQWIYKNSNMPSLSFIIYSALFYSFFAITGLRQTLATALIVFIGYKYVKERKLLNFAIIAFVAFLIHKSSLIFIPYYFIANFSITPIYLFISSIAIGVIALNGRSLYAPIAQMLGFSEEMINYEGRSAVNYAIMMLLICFALFVLYPWISKRRSDAKFMYNLVLLTIVSTLLVIQNQSFMRIQQYYSLVIMAMIPEIILSVDKKSRSAIYIAAVGFMFLYLWSNNPVYRFFWQ